MILDFGFWILDQALLYLGFGIWDLAFAHNH
jgi:hypothetical protein